MPYLEYWVFSTIGPILFIHSARADPSVRGPVSLYALSPRALKSFACAPLSKVEAEQVVPDVLIDVALDDFLSSIPSA